MQPGALQVDGFVQCASQACLREIKASLRQKRPSFDQVLRVGNEAVKAMQYEVPEGASIRVDHNIDLAGCLSGVDLGWVLGEAFHLGFELQL